MSVPAAIKSFEIAERPKAARFLANFARDDAGIAIKALHHMVDADFDEPLRQKIWKLSTGNAEQVQKARTTAQSLPPAPDPFMLAIRRIQLELKEMIRERRKRKSRGDSAQRQMEKAEHHLVNAYDDLKEVYTKDRENVMTDLQRTIKGK